MMQEDLVIPLEKEELLIKTLTNLRRDLSALTEIDAILFDFGGTLYDVSEESVKCWQESLLLQGFRNINPDGYYKALRRARIELLDRYTSEQVHLGRNPALSKEQWSTYNYQILEYSGLEPSHISPDLYDKIAQSIVNNNNKYQLLPGVLKTLQILSKHFKLGIISNTSDNLRQYFVRDNILSMFETIILSCEVDLWKPNPRIFTYACEKIGIQPQKVIFVGDQPLCDYYGASRASLIPILVDSCATSTKLDKLNQMTIIKNLWELPALLGLING